VKRKLTREDGREQTSVHVRLVDMND